MTGVKRAGEHMLATKINKNQGIVLRQLLTIWMLIIDNSRITFVFALMKCNCVVFGEQNKMKET
jgi:hypothetical protein